MNQVSQQTGITNLQVEQHINSFRQASAQTLSDLSYLAAQFDSHGRSLAEAVALIERSNLRTEGTLNERRESLETLAEMLDTSELDKRLARFSDQLDQSMTALNHGIDIKADDLEQRLSRFSGVL